MTKFYSTIQILVYWILGIFSLYSALCFIIDFGLLMDVTQKIHLPYIFTSAIGLFTSGFGINIGVSLLNLNPLKSIINYSFSFSIYYMFLQLFLTIVPSMSACHCITFSESIMNIDDWNSVGFAFLFCALNIFVLFLNKYMIPRALRQVSRDEMKTPMES